VICSGLGWKLEDWTMVKATSSPITQKAMIMKTAELIDCGVSWIVGRLFIADTPLEPGDFSLLLAYKPSVMHVTEMTPRAVAQLERRLVVKKSLGTGVAVPRLASSKETILSAPDNETKSGDSRVTLSAINRRRPARAVFRSLLRTFLLANHSKVRIPLLASLHDLRI
jgi:hypothetical protein